MRFRGKHGFKIQLLVCQTHFVNIIIIIIDDDNNNDDDDNK